MTGRKCYLAIDQGTHASRALLFNDSGQRLTQHRVALAPLGSNDPDRVEYDGRSVLESVRLVVREAQAFAVQQHLVIAAAGLATQRSSVIAWGSESNRPLSPLISWQDTRGRAWIEANVAPAANRVREISGLPLSPHYGASKLRWLHHVCRDTVSGDRPSAYRVGPLVTFLLAHMLEQRPFCVDHVNAGRTQLLDFRKQEWDSWLTNQFQLQDVPLPELRANESSFGELIAWVGDRSLGTPLRAVQGDQSASIYGHGPLAEGTAMVNLGTGAFVCLPVSEPIECTSLLSGVACSNADRVDYLLEGTVNGCGAALDWAIKQLRIADRPFEQLEAAMRTTLAGSVGIDRFKFFNGVNGIGSPFWYPKDQRFFVDGEGSRREIESLHGRDRGAALAAVGESIVFLIQANLDSMIGAATRPKLLRVSGGVSRSDAICQALANLSGFEVRRSAFAEATARGVAWLAAGRPDNWSCLTEATTAFRPRPAKVLGAAYQAYIAWLHRVV